MTVEWQERVRDALTSGDRDRLASLYAEAVSADGEEAASHEWLELVSAMDASAQTG